MRGLRFLAVALGAALMLGCCTGCDDTAMLAQPLPQDYQVESSALVDGLKEVLSGGQKITDRLADVSASNSELLKMHEETIARLTDQTVTNRDRIETLTKYVSTLEETVKEASTKTSVSDFTYGEVDDLKEKVAALEKRLSDLENRCQCGKVQAVRSAPSAPVKSAVSGYGSTGSSVSSTVTYSYPQTQSVKSGGSNGSQYQSDPYAPLPASASYYQQPAVVTQTVQVPDQSQCYQDASGNWICNKQVYQQATTSRPRLVPNWKNR